MFDKDLMDMLVRELKDELEARSESKTGNKAWLRRRLHGRSCAIISTRYHAAAYTALSSPLNVLAERAPTFNDAILQVSASTTF